MLPKLFPKIPLLNAELCEPAEKVKVAVFPQIENFPQLPQYIIYRMLLIMINCAMEQKKQWIASFPV